MHEHMKIWVCASKYSLKACSMFWRKNLDEMSCCSFSIATHSSFFTFTHLIKLPIFWTIWIPNTNSRDLYGRKIKWLLEPFWRAIISKTQLSNSTYSLDQVLFSDGYEYFYCRVNPNSFCFLRLQFFPWSVKYESSLILSPNLLYMGVK